MAEKMTNFQIPIDSRLQGVLPGYSANTTIKYYLVIDYPLITEKGDDSRDSIQCYCHEYIIHPAGMCACAHMCGRQQKANLSESNWTLMLSPLCCDVI